MRFPTWSRPVDLPGDYLPALTRMGGERRRPVPPTTGDPARTVERAGWTGFVLGAVATATALLLVQSVVTPPPVTPAPAPVVHYVTPCHEDEVAGWNDTTNVHDQCTPADDYAAREAATVCPGAVLVATADGQACTPFHDLYRPWDTGTLPEPSPLP